LVSSNALAWLGSVFQCEQNDYNDYVATFYLDGLREQFFVADSASGINDRTMYVHTASYGSQVKVVKQDRLKSASEEDDNDHGEIKAQ
jgi:hypothetical protein